MGTVIVLTSQFLVLRLLVLWLPISAGNERALCPEGARMFPCPAESAEYKSGRLELGAIIAPERNPAGNAAGPNCTDDTLLLHVIGADPVAGHFCRVDHVLCIGGRTWVCAQHECWFNLLSAATS